MRASPEDGRIRIATLTPAGQDLVARAKAGAWPSVEAAVAEICADLDGPLLDQLAAIESRLAATPLQKRGRDAASA